MTETSSRNITPEDLEELANIMDRWKRVNRALTIGAIGAGIIDMKDNKPDALLGILAVLSLAIIVNYIARFVAESNLERRINERIDQED